MSEETPPKEGRDNYIGPPAGFLLDQASDFIHRAFGDVPYLVGSATERVTFRDVDVRLILGDAKFEALFGDLRSAEGNAFWQLMCTGISLWYREVTGLPVDFQIQVSEANSGKHKGKRHALGLFVVIREPKWRKISWLKRSPNSTWQPKRADPPST